ncbi:unnamed protein product [Paramecium pentaurelia]|uniref:Uncharacterized protein n=1 Tax=Paramecium pentaurelia TaxID=43138 RepID=A0A8S1TIF9_9CILI|nr:unnamed protein product [Paramecium pentaurelia]
MNQIRVLCQNDKCIDQIINRVCLNKSCNKNRIICERCLIDHKNHIQDCLLISDIPQNINKIYKQQKDAEAATEQAIENFLKKVRRQIEQKFAFQFCPILSIQFNQNIEDWTQTNFYQFSEKVSQLDFESNYYDKVLNEKINQLNSMQFEGYQYQQLFVQNQSQSRNKIITQGLSAKLDKNYGISNFQPQILRENCNVYLLLHQTFLIQHQMKQNWYSNMKGNTFFKDGKNKFGLYKGSLNNCSLSENNHKRDLILINDQAYYEQNDIQLLQEEECKELFLHNDMNSLMLIFKKGIDNQSLTLINLRTNKQVSIQLEQNFLQVYFCFSLSCQAKIKIV